MALNIKDPVTDRLARQLAEITSESITEATRRALEERLARVRAQAAAQPRADNLRELVARGRARTVLDQRPPDELLGYDEDGTPA